jgi:hypothetical protein
MNFQIAKWNLERYQWKVSHTTSGVVLKIQISIWAMRWGHWIS